MNALDFGESEPDLAVLSRQWKNLLYEARQIIDILPAVHAGKCLLNETGVLYNGSVEVLVVALDSGRLHWREGSIGGVLPVIAV